MAAFRACLSGSWIPLGLIFQFILFAAAGWQVHRGDRDGGDDAIHRLL